ncbi:DUF1385 domain-containing protein, partial [candidate division KSB1 bacterium]|nr:DUF1385 domain-containing protein [candidate division KSB1 bacterium]NIR69390.1 DUF1385 domain-containing protein [candidate division KSB1 bacterium]NIS22740.1 DUF1385 domain-containing protein [candidate division KSB1 bacterium]NIT69586.1 DUF1385 domain-containing protein [candidate division KSB1 bacterium]NIU23248.1 DUF1385 domain-containing protein [candidate division KSB1 bacterium]
VLGVKALSFSGDVAMEDEQNQGQKNKPRKTAKQESFWSKMWLGLTVLFSLAVGLLIFFYVPLILTDYVGAKTGFMFNLIDGLFRLAIFLIYLFAITLIKDIRRVFQYHGAEHKSIFAFESDKKLMPSEAKPLSRFHPRCGTSFLLIVMIVSIFVFMLLGKPNDVGERLLRLTLIPLIGGLSYELIRLSDVGSKRRFWKPLILPGLWLQRLTTKEPDERQLEVAIVALKCALGLDLSGHQNVVFEGKEALELETVKS